MKRERQRRNFPGWVVTWVVFIFTLVNAILYEPIYADFPYKDGANFPVKIIWYNRFIWISHTRT